MRRFAFLAAAASLTATQAHAQHEHHTEPAPPPADISTAPAPPTPRDDLAEQFYSREVMEAARGILRAEHGGGRHAKTTIHKLEVQPGAGPDAYAWEAAFRYGGDFNRVVLKTEGEGKSGHRVEAAEVQALWSRPVDPYFDLQLGLRQDLQSGPRRTYLAAGFQGMAPYWLEMEGAAFLSNTGRLSLRLEAAYDLRITQRLVLEPSVEATFAATADRKLEEGAGLTKLETGFRLRYEVTRHFAPYIGLTRERSFGRTAAITRAAGERAGDTRLAVGLRSWF